MGNDSKKAKSTKEATKVVVRGEKLKNNTKEVLFLYKPLSERTIEIMEHFCDALNQAKPPGCVEVSGEDNVVNLLKHDRKVVKARILKWLTVPNNVVVVCISSSNDQTEKIPREDFIDDEGKLPAKIFPLCFGKDIPSHWREAECYCLGLAKPETVERPNDFEGEGLDTLVAAIRGAE